METNLIKYFEEHISLLDSRLHEIKISAKNGIVEIQLDFILMNGQTVSLVLSDVTEYSFYHNSRYEFYCVTDYKFLRGEEFIYLTLDPDDELQFISELDKDFIFCKNVSYQF